MLTWWLPDCNLESEARKIRFSSVPNTLFELILDESLSDNV